MKGICINKDILKLNRNLLNYLASFVDNNTILKFSKYSKKLQNILNINKYYFKIFSYLNHLTPYMVNLNEVLSNVNNVENILKRCIDINRYGIIVEELAIKCVLFYMEFFSFIKFQFVISMDFKMLTNTLLVNNIKNRNYLLNIVGISLNNLNILKPEILKKTIRIPDCVFKDLDIFSLNYFPILDNLTRLTEVVMSFDIEGKNEITAERNIKFLNGRKLMKLTFIFNKVANSNLELKFCKILHKMNICAEKFTVILLNPSNNRKIYIEITKLLVEIIKKNESIKNIFIGENTNSKQDFFEIRNLIFCSIQDFPNLEIFEILYQRNSNLKKISFTGDKKSFYNFLLFCKERDYSFLDKLDEINLDERMDSGWSSDVFKYILNEAIPHMKSLDINYIKRIFRLRNN